MNSLYQNNINFGFILLNDKRGYFSPLNLNYIAYICHIKPFTMNKAISLLVLIRSLSKAEKRYFCLYTNLQSGKKVYFALFKLLENSISVEDVYNQFCIKYNGRSFDMAVKHLYEVILNCLVYLRENQDIQTKIFNYISKAGILFERSLFEEAFAELGKAKKLAICYENDSLLLLIRRTELKHLSAIDFNGMNERQLVNKQMKINEVMKYIRSANLHMQLYDILKHRFIYKGHIRSDRQRENLNDLVLSELNLIANSSYKGFETEKLHLLFQSIYFLDSGNYKSALRYYQRLITLFDENKHMILNPPIYYLDAVLGILDSLQSAGLYKEMPFFISKLKEIEQGNYPTEFILKVHAHVYLSEFSGAFNLGDFNSAKDLKTYYEDSLFKKITLLSLEIQLQLYLNATILNLSIGELNEARKNMKKILGSGKSLYTFPIYKIARLMNLLLQVELGNNDFFENEIKSIKRNIRFEKNQYQYTTEKLLFRFVQTYPQLTDKKRKDRIWKQYQKEILGIRQNKYERPILKIFDFLAWIESKLTDRSFSDVLKNKSLVV